MTHESITAHWRLNKERYNLVGEICLDCESAIFPPRDLCPECGGNRCIEHKFSGKGEVYSHTDVLEAPEGHIENTPYTIALVKLEEGPLITAQLTDISHSQKVEIGMPVEMVTRKIFADGEKGQIIYGYKFRPRME